MYRPNRIGPWPLIPIETGPGTPDVSTIEARKLLFPVVGTFLTTAGINESTRAETNSAGFAGDTISFADREGVALGCAVSGERFFEDGQYLCSYAGHFSGDVVDMNVIPVLGRLDADHERLLEYSTVPVQSENSFDSDPNRLHRNISCNGTVVLGDFQPSGLTPDGDLFFGWWVINYDGATDLTNCTWTCSIHRYKSDLVPFDPNR